MALQIMAKNDYLDAQLVYVPGMANTPQILQKARQGQYAFLSSKEQERLKRIITDFSKEQEAFALLLVGYCHSNIMLNNVFGKLDDYTELLLPDNMLQDSGFLHLLNTTDAITDEQYKEVELIGWLYQFYISERKDEVFASFKKKKKAEAKDIPAATQIFTPNWIVKYMVQNTVGKIWLDKNPNSKIKSSLKYLVESDTSTEFSASSDSISEPIISDVSQLTLIDPAAGSGHILVEGFDLLYQMYMEEYYTPEEAVESILKNNLFGLDLDDRAAQLATFAILLKAAKQFRDVFAIGWLPNVYAMPEYTTFSVQEIKDFLGAEGTAHEKELTVALSLMEQSKNLGSVMKMNLSDDTRALIEKRFAELKSTGFRDINTEIVYQKVKAFIPVLLILSKKYTAVVANPPYMGSGNMNDGLKNYLNANYPISKSDLFAVFIESMIEMLQSNGRLGCITMESWMFLSSYEQLRKKIIETYSIASLAHFGWHIIGIAFGTATLILEKSKRIKFGEYSFLTINDINRDTNIPYQFPKKDNGRFAKVAPSNFSKIPGSPIAYWASNRIFEIFDKSKSLSDVGLVRQGASTSDNDRFLRYWYEIKHSKIGFNIESLEDANLTDYKWFPYNKGGAYRKWYGNHEYVINYENDGYELKEFQSTLNQGWTVRLKSREYYFKPSVSWPKISSGSFSARYYPNGFIFDVAGCCYFPYGDLREDIIVGYLNSKIAKCFLEFLSPTLNFEIEQIKILPFINIEESNFTVLDEIYELSKQDWNSKETSWSFEKSNLINETTSIKLAFKNWKCLITNYFFKLLENEESINKLFIENYGLQNELTPEVALKDITILQDELKKNDLELLEEKFRAQGKDAIELPINRGEVISQFISYAIGLFMGRYRLDKPGLNIAHPNPTKEELSSYTYNNGEVIIDQDAILPIMGKNCNFNDDVVKQFTQLLDTIWGHEQRTENINFIQECLDKELEKFLVNDLWSYHCGMYKKTPIYWLFSSKKGAFQVLVYMHRMNEFTVEKIRANYLLEHLKYLKSEIIQKEANASSLNTAEAKQLDKLRADLLECEQYDMALKNVADQQIKFDLDDGVAKNYELFETVVAKIK